MSASVCSSASSAREPPLGAGSEEEAFVGESPGGRPVIGQRMAHGGGDVGGQSGASAAARVDGDGSLPVVRRQRAPRPRLRSLRPVRRRPGPTPGRRTRAHLFRASINGRGGPLSYDAAYHRRQTYCAQAGVEIDIHQLRHAHATELINAGVSIEAVRRRLGHASAETTQLYALPDDKVADAEIRAARRRRDRR
ncbi:site-specific integrase [Nonomuraea angiospora]|uniref:tyrosine-type recombinase/integrase n=1 Tax=Nonomuraea angiospora TaxID=46172 RepID=UPI00344FA22A